MMEAAEKRMRDKRESFGGDKEIKRKLERGDI
jgi:hypothetical protein